MAWAHVLAAACLGAAATRGLELRCEGSGAEGKRLTKDLCTQVDKETVHIRVSRSRSVRRLGVQVLEGVAGLAVDVLAVQPRNDDADDDEEIGIDFANKAEKLRWEEVRIYWMRDSEAVGRRIASLEGGSAHSEGAFPGSVFRLTTKGRILPPELLRCDPAAARTKERVQLEEDCIRVQDEVEGLLKERRYAKAISRYEDSAKHCVIGTRRHSAINQPLPRLHSDVDVSGAKLRHEASHLRYLVAANRTSETVGLGLAAHFDRVAGVVDAAFKARPARLSLEEIYQHPRVKSALETLEPDDSNVSVACDLNRPPETTTQRDWGNASVLHSATDFGRVLQDFWTKGVAVIDDVLSPEALEEFQRYTLEEARYTKVRTKYMEASPPNFQPRVLAALARELEARLPEVFDHPDVYLRRWWAFQQVDAEEQPQRPNVTEQTGVDMHADSATVSLNLFATPDEARISGGGLHIWRVLPADDVGFGNYNKGDWEADEKAKILAHRRETVPYKYNRAALFMSDLFHETEDFEFRPGHDAQRINVAVLWGYKHAPGTLFARRPERYRSAAAIPHVEL